ncbi:helix-turn-helix domain-containing protein [Siminovitchia sp. FSL H7-0308]|uniref:Transcriptional regulator of acetoin/glycerol metabolism n=1 Tax=Siminovitchia thermophila TaxID=1245522 RepID=A0ABS2R8V4_9BACI|nr:helix-turn-helix domain-containing protein [Siminovitchia thermophila]MBM7715805.1 transcriptional regulator of acetoin/glycerol metabolism [Siminovitchia thermophila]
MPQYNGEVPLKEQIKKQALIRSIQLCNGDYSLAAKHLGIAGSTLYRQLKGMGFVDRQ